MRFVCLVYLEEERMVRLARDAAGMDALEAAVSAFDAGLLERGVLAIASPLRRAREARTVRVRGGRMRVTDGPYAESREQLGGFLLVDAPDLDAAVALAAGSPLARLGSIEVRPLGHPGWGEPA